MNAKTIENRIVKIEVGTPIEHGVSGRVEKLLPCDDWDKADFRWPNPIYEWRESRAIACNVEITGRTLQYRGGRYVVKVKIVWVGDDEPNTESEGWAIVDPWKCPTPEEAA